MRNSLSELNPGGILSDEQLRWRHGNMDRQMRSYAETAIRVVYLPVRMTVRNG